jgi:hypothetical protein
MKKIALALLASVLVVGCNSMSQKSYSDMRREVQHVPKDQARIVLLRTNEHNLFEERSATIRINDDRVSALPKGAFHYHDVDPKEFKLSIRLEEFPGECAVKVNPKGGQSYFFEVVPIQETYDKGKMALLLGGMTALTVISTVEAHGKACAGMFALHPQKKNDATQKLQPLVYMDDMFMKEGFGDNKFAEGYETK